MLIEKLRALTTSRLAVINRDDTVHAAALSLSRPGIGLVVVCDAKGSAEGVLSKSDLVRHLISPAPQAVPVSALMSTSMVTCSPQDDLHEVWQFMTDRNLQNVPVVDVRAKPIGVLDIRDAMKALFEEEEIREQMLFNYVTGVGYR